jgi:ribonuclease HIII
MTISFKVSDETIDKLNEFYSDLKRDKTPAYAVFQAQDGDTVVTLYESKKIVFQGRDADLASDFWIATEKMANKNLNVKNSDIKNNDKSKDIYIDPKIYNATTIGSDEVGTGDYFGPIVVTGTFVRKEDIPYLEKLGITDSKKMSDEKILEVVPELIKKIPYTTFILSNKEYNEWSSKMNMNKIKAILHNKVLSDLTLKYNADYVVVDEFAKPFVYYNYLKEVPNIVKNITFLTKGEIKCLSVACSSVISRYVFLKEFKKLSDKINITLPLGAGSKVDEIATSIVKNYGFEKLEDIAKLNFKNTFKVKKMIKEEN